MRFVSDGPVQIGGYARDEYGGYGFTEEPSNAREWVLLADWHPSVYGREGLTIHWPIRWPDLVARRFDRVKATTFWNP